MGGQPSRQARAPDPGWRGDGGKDASHKRVWGRQMAGTGHLPSAGAYWHGGAGSALPPPNAPRSCWPCCLITGLERLGSEGAVGAHSGPLLGFSTWNPLALGRSLPHTLPSPALKAIPAPHRLGSSLGVVSDSPGYPCPHTRPASEKGRGMFVE